MHLRILRNIVLRNILHNNSYCIYKFFFNVKVYYSRL